MTSKVFKRFMITIVTVGTLIPVFLFAQHSMKLSDYYPIEVGNTWTYHAKGFRKTGKLEVTYSIEKYDNGFYVKRETYRLDGEEMGQGGLSTDLQLVNGAISETRNDNKTYVYLKLPLKVGNKWKWSEDKVATIVAVGVRWEVPAGIFRDCIKVKVRSVSSDEAAQNELNEDAYFARGVGLIQLFETVLTQYDLK